MIGNKLVVLRILCLSFVTSACVGMSTGAYAAAEVPATTGSPAAVDLQQPVEALEELSEVRVRGERLAQVITDAEDEFFELYNALNRDSKYDVYCGFMSLDPGSLIMVRTCMPAFIAFNVQDHQGQNRVGTRCYGKELRAQPVVGADLFGPAVCFDSGYVPPTALVAMEGRKAYASNVMKVVSGDPRLISMAGDLDALYREMELVQRRFHRVRDGTPAPAGNPRTL